MISEKNFNQDDLFIENQSHPPPQTSEIDDIPIGYLKFQGKRVEEGVLDGKTAGITLIGLDSSLRYFISSMNLELVAEEYEIPVRIEKGSWEINVLGLIAGGAIFVAASYAGGFVKKIGANDAGDLTSKDILRKSLIGVMWCIKISLHVGTVAKKTLDDLTGVKWKNGNSEIGIPNAEGRYLFVPVEYFNLFGHFPFDSFGQIAGFIENERELVLGVHDNSGNVEEVTVNNSQKGIFHKEEESEILFPELEHEQYIELKGHVTRGNESANSIGFRYNEHILTCYPTKGNIKEHKSKMFLNCEIIGKISREDRFGNYIEKYLKIYFDQLIPEESDNTHPDLFGFEMENK
ncbi:MAG: hypothetical protein L3J71_06590 [Victivallaceae bacterium]|nr:hypothetical protein [Victivallaceae bacterium]